MCGIFAYSGNSHGAEQLYPYFMKIRHRGPDNTQKKWISRHSGDPLFLGFHRLRINGLDDGSNQPLVLGNLTLICNGEIYNYAELGEKYGFQFHSHSDCEVILHLFKRFGINEACQLLDGVFAFVLYDGDEDRVYAARDHLGIRGMYIGYIPDGAYVITSEAKAATFAHRVQQFPPGTWWSDSNGYRQTCPSEFNKYWRHDYEQLYTPDQWETGPLVQDEVYEWIRNVLTRAVEKRLMSDVEIGCLLSGGLDSSLITAIMCRLSPDPSKIKTFSIGMPGSPDLSAAREVADYLGTDHHHVELAEEDFLAAVEETVHTLGSWDTTTIRASVGHRLIAKYVRDHTDVKVLFSGETADEFGSYLYFQQAPSPAAFQDEAVRLLSDIHYFDGLRGDRCIAAAGLEARVPFSDRDFMRLYMGLPAEWRMFGPASDDGRMEKYLLRKAFEGYIPDSVLWRRKNGFSDSVSQITRSWSFILQEWIDTQLSDEEWEEEKRSPTFLHEPPRTKEAYYYRKLFAKYYGHHDTLTPYQWLPKWCGDVNDPSARILKIYKAD